MTIPTYFVDSFTSTPFAGNPTAVCLVINELKQEKMLSIARELNCPVTAFLNRREQNSYDIRYFTTVTEISACGHATLASAKIVFDGHTGSESIFFHTIDKVIIKATVVGENILMAYPVYQMKKFSPSINLHASLRIPRYKTLGYSPQLETLFIELDDTNLLRSVEPDFVGLRNSTDAIIEVVLTSVSDDERFDYLLRSFCPWIGIDEDPVTGSVHSVLGNFWKKRLKKQNMKAYQASARGGEILINAFDERVEIGGNSVILLRGEIFI